MKSTNSMKKPTGRPRLVWLNEVCQKTEEFPKSDKLSANIGNLAENCKADACPKCQGFLFLELDPVYQWPELFCLSCGYRCDAKEKYANG